MTNATSDEHSHQYVTFTLGDTDYGIQIMNVQEFMGYSSVTPIPNTPKYVRGVLNLRGTIIPVFDLRLRFGLPARLYELSVIVVAIVANRTVGLVVDAVSDVVDIKASDIQETPELSGRAPTAYLRGLAKMGQRLVILLNLEHLVSIDDAVTVTGN
jgi:purine-binding chemotaxis protein CheW